MNEQKEMLVRIIRAARKADTMADTIRNLSCDTARNKADDIAGLLADALNVFNGEKLGVNDNFTDSRTYTWLFRSCMSDNETADEFIRMAEENRPKQPKPNLINRIQFQDMVKKFGGYSTPEGEWPK